MYNTPNKNIYFQDLGLIEYKKAWDYQTQLHETALALKLENRKKESELVKPDNHLLFCSHPHVYTLGKSGLIEHLLLNNEELNKRAVQFFKTNRGGDITYHGPGQIVGYPIIDLANFFTDIGKFMRLLEEMVIRTLAEYGIEAGRIKGATGVWLDWEDKARARKICAMGIRCSRWVTMHGWALNVNTDLSYFGHIIPCGLVDKGVTSLNKELGVATVPIEPIKAQLKKHFIDLFSATFI